MSVVEGIGVLCASVCTHKILHVVENWSEPVNLTSLGRQTDKFYYRPRNEGDNVIDSIRPSACPSVCLSISALTAEPPDLFQKYSWAPSEKRVFWVRILERGHGA